MEDVFLTQQIRICAHDTTKITEAERHKLQQYKIQFKRKFFLKFKKWFKKSRVVKRVRLRTY